MCKDFKSQLFISSYQIIFYWVIFLCQMCYYHFEGLNFLFPQNVTAYCRAANSHAASEQNGMINIWMGSRVR